MGTWNSLPLSIREATSVNIFKALVKKFFYGLKMYWNVFFAISIFIFIITISINLYHFFVPLVFCYNMGSLTLLHYILCLLL